MRRTFWLIAALPALAAAWILSASVGASQQPAAPAEVPKEVRALAGTYTGAWTLYGLDDKEEVVKKRAWTDTVTAASPEVKGDRGQVSITDEMTFDGGKTPPFKMEGKEGYYLTGDGKLGDYFTEVYGKIHRLTKLGDGVWTYATPAAEQELAQLGFPKGAAGQHVVVKVVTTEQGAETHRISRVTTVTWKGKDGKERTLQFVSLQGYHKRQA